MKASRLEMVRVSWPEGDYCLVRDDVAKGITRDDFVGTIWEVQRDITGVRPRWIDFDSMSDQELIDYTKRSLDEHALMMEMESRDEEERQRYADAEKAVVDGYINGTHPVPHNNTMIEALRSAGL